MLHIMDYRNRIDFNHPLLVGAAILAISLTISGVVLIFKSFNRQDFRWLIPVDRKKVITNSMR